MLLNGYDFKYVIYQGWKLQTVRLSGTGKNRAGQVKILDTFPKERLKYWILLSACLSRAGKNSAGQVDLFDTFPKERQTYFVISMLHAIGVGSLAIILQSNDSQPTIWPVALWASLQ